jgi:putative transposase
VKEYQSQSHVRYECKYHIVWCPKYRSKKLYGLLRQRFGEMMHDLCRQKGVELIEGHAWALLQKTFPNSIWVLLVIIMAV